MKKLLLTAKRFLSLIAGFIPKKLPSGMPEFNSFYSNIIFTYQLPDLPSYKQAVASMIMHIDQSQDKKAPRYFGTAIRKAMANQTAFEVLQQLKEAEKKTTEATPPQETHAGESIQNPTV